MMLTNFDALEHWLINAQVGSEIMFFEPFENPLRNPDQAANRDANFARCYNRLKTEADARRVYLSIDGTGRYVATKLS